MAQKAVALCEHTSKVVSQLAEEKFYSCICNKKVYTTHCSIIIICTSSNDVEELERSQKTATGMTKRLENPPYSYRVRIELQTILTVPQTEDIGTFSFCPLFLIHLMSENKFHNKQTAYQTGC